MNTDYQIAKQIPVEMARFEEKVIIVNDVATFRRYLSQIAKKAGACFNTKKLDSVTIQILRTK